MLLLHRIFLTLLLMFPLHLLLHLLPQEAANLVGRRFLRGCSRRGSEDLSGVLARGLAPPTLPLAQDCRKRRDARNEK